MRREWGVNHRKSASSRGHARPSNKCCVYRARSWLRQQWTAKTSPSLPVPRHPPKRSTRSMGNCCLLGTACSRLHPRNVKSFGNLTWLSSESARPGKLEAGARRSRSAEGSGNAPGRGPTIRKVSCIKIAFTNCSNSAHIAPQRWTLPLEKRC